MERGKNGYPAFALHPTPVTPVTAVTADWFDWLLVPPRRDRSPTPLWQKQRCRPPFHFPASCPYRPEPSHLRLLPRLRLHLILILILTPSMP